MVNQQEHPRGRSLFDFGDELPKIGAGSREKSV
jgi:hypothetical protein